ncbi:MAG: ArdC family protein [Methylocystis sp.]
MKSRFDLHQEITDRIVAAIEAGVGEFKMPWHRAASTKLPINATTGRAYRGVNILSLWITAQSLGYESHEWATFKQWQERGATVRKGEKGTPIIFYKELHIESGDSAAIDDPEGERKIPFARASWVFNASQVDGYLIETPALPERLLFERIASVDRVIAATGAHIDFGGSRACYNRLTDRISIPEERAFIGTATSTAQEAFYATILHELSHWVGAECRLNREKGKRFADRAYAFEELIAETSAVFLCAELGITNEPRPDHAQYIAQYLTILKNDKKAIFAAAAAASAATDFILAFSRNEQEAAA